MNYITKLSNMQLFFAFLDFRRLPNLHLQYAQYANFLSGIVRPLLKHLPDHREVHMEK